MIEVFKFLWETFIKILPLTDKIPQINILETIKIFIMVGAPTATIGIIAYLGFKKS